LEIARLLVDRERVGSQRGGEAALWTEGQILRRNVLRGLVDAAQQQLLGLQLARLGGDQAEDNGDAARHEAQGREVASAFGVVLQQKAIDVQGAEKQLGRCALSAA